MDDHSLELLLRVHKTGNSINLDPFSSVPHHLTSRSCFSDPSCPLSLYCFRRASLAAPTCIVSCPDTKISILLKFQPPFRENSPCLWHFSYQFKQVHCLVCLNSASISFFPPMKIIIAFSFLKASQSMRLAVVKNFCIISMSSSKSCSRVSGSPCLTDLNCAGFNRLNYPSMMTVWALFKNLLRFFLIANTHV